MLKVKVLMNTAPAISIEMHALKNLAILFDSGGGLVPDYQTRPPATWLRRVISAFPIPLQKNQSHMSIQLQGLRTVIYFVDDLTAAKEWYNNAFGIEPYFDEAFYVGYNVGGYELGLHPGKSNIGDGPVATTYWGVDDVYLSNSELIAAGATTVEQPTDVGGGIIVASVRDPWGNVFGIIFNPDFELE
jgi:predicted enzyme related to lactoylglutathione lyase